MTVALPWSSVGLSTGFRGNLRVFTASATAFHYTWRFHGKCHGCGMARAAVLSVATSVVPTMATHRNTTATPTAYSMATYIPYALPWVFPLYLDLPWYAVGACRGLPLILMLKLPWLVLWASTVFRVSP